MKLQILSDLHLEFRDGLVAQDDGSALPEWEHLVRSYIAKDAKERVLILAGDICQYTGFESTLKSALKLFSKKYKAVVYVLGNHEYYDAKAMADVESGITEAAAVLPNVHVLNSSMVTIDGQRFVGGTMWYSPIRDQKAIPGLWNWTYSYNANFKTLLNHELGPKDIVVTHHLPSMKCVDPLYRFAANQSYFVSPCDNLIEVREPRLWVHGHTHASVKQKIYETLVVANPAGYPGERSDFDPFCFVNVGKKAELSK